MKYLETTVPVTRLGVSDKDATNNKDAANKSATGSNDFGQVAVYEQEGSPELQEQPLLFCHATGFHAHCWDEIVRQFPERRIILLDTRCHGRSSNITPPFEWGDFTNDLVQVIEYLNLQNIIAIGHSMGAHIIIRAAGMMPERFTKIMAIDPVIVTEDMPRMRDLIPEGYEHPVAKRRNNWSSSQELYQSFSKKEPFIAWHPQVLKDYCDYALEKTDQGLKLACPPKLEANIYLTPDSEGAYALIPKVQCEVQIVRARDRNKNDPPFSFGPSPTNPKLAEYFSNATDIQLKENSHFIPMEIPHKLSSMIKDFIT
jgi:pimeloyl-ACP methyl ester carboxylesterase